MFDVFVCVFQRSVFLLVYLFLSALAAEPSLPLHLPLFLPLSLRLSPPLTPSSLTSGHSHSSRTASPFSLLPPFPPLSHTPRICVLLRLKSVRPPTLLEWSAPSPLRIGPPIKSSVLCRQVQGKVSIWSRPDLLSPVPPFVLSLWEIGTLSPCLSQCCLVCARVCVRVCTWFT